jgi:hypothetical protein
MKRISLFLLFLCLYPIAMYAQTAEVGGAVQDPTGAVIAKASVEFRNQDTGVRRQTTTNGDGIYHIVGIDPGKYDATVQASGFKTLTRENIVFHVADKAQIDFQMQVGQETQSITVDGSGSSMNTTDASVSTVIDKNFVENLPLNGRSFNTLLQLTPGVVIAPGSSYANQQGQFSISGQRTSSNNFLLDGVSANFGITPTFGLGTSGSGGTQALSALGGTSSLVSVEALQEFRIETSSFAPEFGTSPGGQVILTTRSGTNDFHGGLYEYFRNTVLDANDWFANQADEPRSPEHHNDFGGYLGGPIDRNRTFFFLSYEGVRLDQPGTQVVQVPSEYARTIVPSGTAAFLLAYPKPTDQTITPGVYTGSFTGNYSNPSSLDAGSIRIDHTFNSRFTVFGRYNDAPSDTAVRTDNLAEVDTTTVNTKTLTIGSTMALSARLTNALRGNYSVQHSQLVTSLDNFGGAVPPSLNILGPGFGDASQSLLAFYTYDTSYYQTGPDTQNSNTQLNVTDDLSLTVKSHQLKVGANYRALMLDVRPFSSSLEYLVDSVSDFITNGQALLYSYSTRASQLLSQTTSVYAQDTWKLSPRLTMTYGLRWELSPAPSARGNTILTAWQNVDTPPNIALAPLGTRLWNTTYGNFAPRVGLAYSPDGNTVLRGGFGIFYDLGSDSVGYLAASFPNETTYCCANVTLPLADATPYLPVISTQPPYSYAMGFSPNLLLPRSFQWNVAIERKLGARDAVSVTYAGQAGRDLLRQAGIAQPNANFSGPFTLTENSARSNYNALQMQYRRPISAGLQALLNYTWSHSLDNASNDIEEAVANAVISSANDYASSSFDSRQSVSGALSYEIPAAAKSGSLALLTRDWSIDAVIVARSGFPFNATVLTTRIGGAFPRPNLVAGQPLWIPDVNAGGGKILNSAAFTIPALGTQGTESRNDIPGFGLTQLDLSFARKFVVHNNLNVQFRTDSFNIANHPNFANPPAYIGFGPAYLMSMQMLNQGLGGLSPLFQEGGPRSLQISLKVSF